MDLFVNLVKLYELATFFQTCSCKAIYDRPIHDYTCLFEHCSLSSQWPRNVLNSVLRRGFKKRLYIFLQTVCFVHSDFTIFVEMFGITVKWLQLIRLPAWAIVVLPSTHASVSPRMGGWYRLMTAASPYKAQNNNYSHNHTESYCQPHVHVFFFNIEWPHLKQI